ncbi:MAG: glycosyltransferase [Thermomicrobium sp.]|nr:glycosyltransferase [Thermomicrobium sp.]MDW7981385.1 glycosyltransferase [Thermomicrobium sp.]
MISFRDWFLTALTLLAAIAHARVVLRLIDSARRRIHRAFGAFPPPLDHGPVTVIVPVYNEQSRLAPCLEGLLRQPDLVQTIMVVDTGSTDRTRHLVAAYAARDGRVRLVEAGPPPLGWNGKSWGIAHGLRHAPATPWYLLVDADVRPAPTLVPRLVAAAASAGVAAASVALRQHVTDTLSWILHPSMLSSLVYRVGLPGRIDCTPDRAFANGQVLLLSRDAAALLRAFHDLAYVNAEDVALARALTARGRPVAFFDSLDASFVTMYANAAQVWHRWPRSLPMLDGYSRQRAWLDLATLGATQGLWLPLLLLAWMTSGRRILRFIAWFGVAFRLGLLLGMRRAYSGRSLWYWISPGADPIVVLRILQAALQKQHDWRGRQLVPRRS